MTQKDIDEINDNMFIINGLLEVMQNIDSKTPFPEPTIEGLKVSARIIQNDVNEINDIVNKEQNLLKDWEKAND